MRSFVLAGAIGVLAGIACTTAPAECIVGAQGCTCTAQNTCDDGLRCDDGRCRGSAGGSTGDTTVPAGSSGSVDDGGATSTADTTGAVDPSSGVLDACDGATIRVAAYNIKSVGAENSDEWNALGEVLQRIDADVVCVEEIDDGETAPLRALAQALGYGEPVQANQSPPIGGTLRNGCMSRLPITRIASYTAGDLSPDPQANDVSRDFLAVDVEVGPTCHLALVAVHAKSGQEDVDRFRRQVEVVRLRQAVADVHARRPNAPLVVMGDFNENLDDPAIGQDFASAPSGLPPSYQLGSDIALPLLYDPFTPMTDMGLVRLDPTQEDSDETGTWNVSQGSVGVRIDYIYTDGPELAGALVYTPCRDDGVDEPPAGAWLPLAGDPLDCSIGALASDHSPLVADLVLP